MDAPALLLDGPDLRIGVLDNVFMMDLIGPVTLPMVQTMGKTIGRHARGLKRPYVLLMVLRPSSPPPQGEIRQALISITTAGRGPLEAFVTLAVGTNLRLAIVHSVFADFALAAPPKMLVEVTTSLPDAVHHLARPKMMMLEETTITDAVRTFFALEA